MGCASCGVLSCFAPFSLIILGAKLSLIHLSEFWGPPHYTAISLAASLRLVELGLMAPIIGWLIDRFGIRKVISIGCGILCIGLLLFSQINSLALFYTAFFLIGIGSTSGSQAAVQTIVSKWFHKRFGFAIGIATAGFGLSGLLLPAVTSIIELYGWRTAALAIMFSMVIVAIPAIVILRNKPEQYGLSPDGNSIDKYIMRHTEISKDTNIDISDDSSFNLKQAFHTAAFWQLSIVFAIMYFIIQAVLTHIMPYLSSISVDRHLSSFIAAAIPIISIVGRIGFGFFSDRFDKRKVTILAFIVICLTMFAFAAGAHFGIYFIVIASSLFGFGFGGAVTLSGVLIRDQFGKKYFGSIFGALTGVSFIGNALGAPAAGCVYDTLHNYQMFWIGAALLSIMAIILIQMSRRKAAEYYN